MSRDIFFTCQEYEEESGAVKQNKLQQQDDTNEPLAVSLQHLVHDDVEHGVEVDGDEANWDADDVMKIINGNKITTRLIANNNVDYLNTKNQYFVEEQQFWSQNHEFEIFGRDFRLRKGQKTNKWW